MAQTGNTAIAWATTRLRVENGCFPRDQRDRADAEPAAGRRLILLRGGLAERFLERALASGLAGDRQLRGPSGDAAGERCGTLAARDLDRRALTELGEQPGAVLLWRLIRLVTGGRSGTEAASRLLCGRIV